MSLLVNSEQKGVFSVSLNLRMLINKGSSLSELHGLFTGVMKVFHTVMCERVVLSKVAACRISMRVGSRAGSLIRKSERNVSP